MYSIMNMMKALSLRAFIPNLYTSQDIFMFRMLKTSTRCVADVNLRADSNRQPIGLRESEFVPIVTRPPWAKVCCIYFKTETETTHFRFSQEHGRCNEKSISDNSFLQILQKCKPGRECSESRWLYRDVNGKIISFGT